jgi:hypothetical protein
VSASSFGWRNGEKLLGRSPIRDLGAKTAAAGGFGARVGDGGVGWGGGRSFSAAACGFRNRCRGPKGQPVAAAHSTAPRQCADGGCEGRGGRGGNRGRRKQLAVEEDSRRESEASPTRHDESAFFTGLEVVASGSRENSEGRLVFPSAGR